MRNILFLLSLVLTLFGHPGQVLSCPYCTVESATLTEEMEGSDVVLLAQLIKPAEETTADDEQFGVVDPDSGMATFRVVKVLKGEDMLGDTKEIKAVFFGDPAGEEQRYFIRGIGGDRLDWNVPIAITKIATDYIQQLPKLPESGPERMRYFIDYLQHEDPLLAQDAYDEFARCTYSDVQAIADKIDRERLWQWILDPLTSANRRSLFFTLLGVVGTEEDQQRLEAMMLTDIRVLRSAAEAAAAASISLGGPLTLPMMPELVSMEQRRRQLGFNAMVGCYLKLTGSEGLDLLDREFLSSENDDPTKVYGVLLALRFLGDETEDVPIERLTQSMRLILAKPEYAEQAIRDLSRWEDWDSLDNLVKMFNEVGEGAYVRDTIVAYLDQAALQEGEVAEKAVAALADLEPVDPESFKRARTMGQFGFLGYARPGSRPPGEAPPLNKPEAESDLAEVESQVPTDLPPDPALMEDPGFEIPPAETTAEIGDETNESDLEVAQNKEVPPETPIKADLPPETSGIAGPWGRVSITMVVAGGFVLIVAVVMRGGV